MERTIDTVIQDIKDNPLNHQHEWEDLYRCCILNGVVYTSIMDAHTRYACAGKNGKQRCDVVRGPCGCGAFH